MSKLPHAGNYRTAPGCLPGPPGSVQFPDQGAVCEVVSTSLGWYMTNDAHETPLPALHVPLATLPTTEGLSHLFLKGKVLNFLTPFRQTKFFFERHGPLPQADISICADGMTPKLGLRASVTHWRKCQAINGLNRSRRSSGMCGK